MNDIDFVCPYVSILVFVVVLFVVLHWLFFIYRDRSLNKFASSGSLKKILYKPSLLREWICVMLICLSWIAMVFALMQPRGNPRYPEEKSEHIGNEKVVEEESGSTQCTKRYKAHDVIFLLDTSASMSVNDTRTGETRLQYGKEIVDEIVSRLNGQAVALYAFTSKVTTMVPPTVDYLYFRLILRDIDINEGDVAGTDMLEALDVLKNRHWNGISQKIKTLIILTDGCDTYLERLHGEQRKREVVTLLDRLGDTEKNSIRVFCIGLGTKEGAIIPNINFEEKVVKSSLDEDLLTQLSDKGRGSYYFANRYSSIAIADDIVSIMQRDDLFEDKITEAKNVVVERTIEEKNFEPIYDLYFQIPLAVAIICCLQRCCFLD